MALAIDTENIFKCGIAVAPVTSYLYYGKNQRPLTLAKVSGGESLYYVPKNVQLMFRYVETPSKIVGIIYYDKLLEHFISL